MPVIVNGFQGKPGQDFSSGLSGRAVAQGLPAAYKAAYAIHMWENSSLATRFKLVKALVGRKAPWDFLSELNAVDEGKELTNVGSPQAKLGTRLFVYGIE